MTAENSNAFKLWPLDRIIEGLLAFSTDKDLVQKIHDMYDHMDQDQSGSLSCEELNANLQVKPYPLTAHSQPLSLTPDP